MPSDEYTAIARGPLKLKGAKVTKPKKNKTSKKNQEHILSNLAHAVVPGSSTTTAPDAITQPPSHDASTSQALDKREKSEYKRASSEEREAEDTKTEAERELAERKRKRLNEMAKSGRPDLLKTHKQRVEELNSHLSRLSEHHDMPKIGPG